MLEAPENVKIAFHNNTIIHVAFDPVVRAGTYEISHVVNNEDIHGTGSSWEIDGQTGEISFPVTGLIPFTNYDVRVLPVNQVTRGYNSTINQWSKLNPILDFKPAKRTPNEMILKWSDVEHAVYYRVFYVAENTNITQQDTSTSSITIR